MIDLLDQFDVPFPHGTATVRRCQKSEHLSIAKFQSVFGLLKLLLMTMTFLPKFFEEGHSQLYVR
jgi:hypothetical protein